MTFYDHWIPVRNLLSPTANTYFPFVWILNRPNTFRLNSLMESNWINVYLKCVFFSCQLVTNGKLITQIMRTTNCVLGRSIPIAGGLTWSTTLVHLTAVDVKMLCDSDHKRFLIAFDAVDVVVFFRAVSRFYENKPTKCEHYERNDKRWLVRCIWEAHSFVILYANAWVGVCVCVYVFFCVEMSSFILAPSFSRAHISFSDVVGCRFRGKIEKGNFFKNQPICMHMIQARSHNSIWNGIDTCR